MKNTISQDFQLCETPEIEDYIKRRKELQQIFLDYVDVTDENDSYFILVEIVNDIIFHKKTNDLIEFFHLLSIISYNHHRNSLF